MAAKRGARGQRLSIGPSLTDSDTVPSEIEATYEQLMARMRPIYVLRSAASITQWDMETMMPPRGLNLKSEQLALLSVIGHEWLVAPEIESLLTRLETNPALASLDEVSRRNVELARREYNDEAKLPTELVEKLGKQSTIAVGIWKRAKAARDFSIFRPELEKNIELKKQAAEILMGVKGTKTQYDALVDQFEPGMTSERIGEVFAEMRDGLIAIMKKVEGAQVKPDMTIQSRKVPIKAQHSISAAAMDFIGYDTKSANAGGRLDETEHPFTTGYYDDVRITTHYYEERFSSSLFSVLHEGGHALYDQSLPSEWMYQPVGNPCSYGIHESQSRFVENMVGRSPEFIAWFTPKLRRMTGKALRGVKLKELVRAMNAVVPSKIRTEADEVTYGLHVIIRFEIERDIFADKVKVEELPQVWNEKYERYLGVDIEHDSEGVMQDTHWAGNAFGYFPSYALGNIYGGMFLEKMAADVPNWRASVRKGDFNPVKAWLHANVHSKANLYDPADLVKNVTGKDLEIRPFIRYLDEKMSRIYEL